MSQAGQNEKCLSLQQSHGFRSTNERPLLNKTSTDVIRPLNYYIDECLWAVQYPELQKACFLAKVCPIESPKYCQYRDIAGILQVGPTCGLTILSMLLNGTPSPKHLLIIAKNMRYTNNGEMFCARNLFQLIYDHLIKPLPNIENANSFNARECVLYEGRLNCAKIRDCLLASDCILVPYPLVKQKR